MIRVEDGGSVGQDVALESFYFRIEILDFSGCPGQINVETSLLFLKRHTEGRQCVGFNLFLRDLLLLTLGELTETIGELANYLFPIIWALEWVRRGRRQRSLIIRVGGWGGELGGRKKGGRSG